MLQRALTVSGGGGGKCEYIGTLPSTGKVTCGFKPKSVIMCGTLTASGSGQAWAMIYDEATSTTKYRLFLGTSIQNSEQTIGDSGSYGFDSIDNDGFTFNPLYYSRVSNAWYIAIP